MSLSLSNLYYRSIADDIIDMIVDDGNRPPFPFTYVPTDPSPMTALIKAELATGKYIGQIQAGQPLPGRESI